MQWPDEEFLNVLRSRAEAALRNMDMKLVQFLDDAFQDIYLYVRNHPNIEEKIVAMSSNKQLYYLTKCMVNWVLKLKLKKKHPHPVPPDIKDVFAGLTGEADDEILLIMRRVDQALCPIEREVAQLLRLGYAQNQIADMLEVSEATVTRTRKKSEKIIRQIRLEVEEGRAMAEHQQDKNWITDDLISEFIGGREVPNWNDNLRRMILRLVKPLESLRSIQEGKLNPPIPPRMKKRILNLIAAHKNPPRIEEALEVAANDIPILPEACMNLLDAARLLNQPYRWISVEESLRAIEDKDHVEFVTGQLVRVFATSLQIFNSARDSVDGQNISTILCDKLENWVDRFATRGRDSYSPFEPSPIYTAPLHLSAVTMESDVKERFHKSIKDFNDSCRAVKEDGDSKNTFKDLQSIVDFVIRLLGWKRYDAPRYLAPALVEEAIEVVLAVHGPVGDKSNVFKEMGDLLGMALWLSNLLAIANLGDDIKSYYQNQGS